MRASFEDDLNVKFDSLNRTIWAPVKIEGKINMYGYMNWANRKKDSWAEVYFQKDENEFAINPIQSHKFMKGLNSQRPQIKASLLKVFNDCPKFEQNIDAIIKGYIDDFYEVQKLTNEEKTSSKNNQKIYAK